MSRFPLVVVAASLLLVACAKKKELPPRGTLLGRVEYSASLARRLKDETKFDAAKHCTQAVQLANDKGIAIEITPGQCPEGLIPSPLVSLSFSPVPDGARYAVAMPDYVFLDTLPVGVLRAATQTTPMAAPQKSYVLDDLCTIDVNLADTCRVIADASGTIVKVHVDRAAGMRHLRRIAKELEEMESRRQADRNELIAMLFGLQADLSALSTRVDKLDERVTRDISNLQTALTALMGRVDNLDARLTAQIQAVRAAIQNLDRKVDLLNNQTVAAIRALQTALDQLNAKVDANDRATKQAIEALKTSLNRLEARVKAVETQVQALQNDLAVLIARVDVVEGRLTDASNTIRELREAITELRTKIAANDAAAKDAVKKLQQAIDALAAKVAGNDASTQAMIAGIKNRLDVIEAILAGN